MGRRRVVGEKGVLVKVWGGAQQFPTAKLSATQEFLVAKSLCKE